LLCCSLLLTCTFLHLFLLVTYFCIFIAYLHCSCLFVVFLCFSTLTHVALAYSLPSQDVLAYLCYLALAQQCLMYPLKLKLHACQCLRYPLRFKLLSSMLQVPIEIQTSCSSPICYCWLVVSFFVVFPLSCSCRLRNEEAIYDKCYKFYFFIFLVFFFLCTFNGLEEAEWQGRDFLWCPKRNWSPCLGASKALKMF